MPLMNAAKVKEEQESDEEAERRETGRDGAVLRLVTAGVVRDRRKQQEKRTATRSSSSAQLLRRQIALNVRLCVIFRE